MASTVKKRYLVLILLFVYLIMNTIEIKTTENQTIVKPYETTEIVTYPKTIKQEICINRSYRYQREWIDIIVTKSYTEPSLKITNLESVWGVFSVNFSYFDDSKYPYENYKDRLYEDFKDELSRDDADMSSETLVQAIGPGESHIFATRTTNKNITEYWALGNVFEPEITECMMKDITYNVTENRTVIKFSESTEEVVVRRKVRELFLGFDIILFLAIVIIILILSIRKKLHDAPKGAT